VEGEEEEKKLARNGEKKEERWQLYIATNPLSKGRWPPPPAPWGRTGNGIPQRRETTLDGWMDGAQGVRGNVICDNILDPIRLHTTKFARTWK
jgi:hypothetical protein